MSEVRRLRRHPAPKCRYPWRIDNHLYLLKDGDVFFPRMLSAIDAARRYVMLEMYLFESGRVADRFIGALAGAARRGVKVYVLLDHFGSLGLTRNDHLRLSQAGVITLSYNPLNLGKLFNNFARDHRKLLLVDGRTAFVGGVGITDAFDPVHHPEKRWRETMVEMQGPVVSDWQELFVSLWDRHADVPMPPLVSSPPWFEQGARARVTLSAGPLRQEGKRMLLRNLRSARKRAWLSTAYFLPGWSMLRALRAAARRGVDVRLLLPGPLTDHPGVRQAGRRHYARLLRSGVRIFEYQPRVLHSKVSLCDRHVTIGSSNHDRWNQRWNLEANLLVEDAAFVDQVRALFEADFHDCIELGYTSWRQRPVLLRVSEWILARVDLWLHALGSGRRGD